jgi:hypothetical protein
MLTQAEFFHEVLAVKTLHVHNLCFKVSSAGKNR